MAVHNQVTRAIHAPQQRVIGLLHAALAHHVSRLIERVLRQREVLLADLAHIPDQVRRKAIPRVQPPLLFQQFQVRQLVTVRLDKGLFVRRNVRLQRNRLILRRVLKVAQSLLHLLHRQVQAVRNHAHLGVGVLHLLAHQEARHRRIVVDQQPAFPVQQFAPRCKNRHLVHAVCLG